MIKLPHISNFTDFEPLVADKEIELSFISNAGEAKNCDLIIVPGSKRVVDDLDWLCKRGFKDILQDKKRHIVAICGGYEMMFERLLDSKNIESDKEEVKGFGRFKGDVIFKKEKIVKKGSYNLFGIMVKGYEIHNGTTKKRAKQKDKIYGTFVHGLFDSDEFREKLFFEINPNYKGYNYSKYKTTAIQEFTQHIEKNVNMDKIEQALHE